MGEARITSQNVRRLSAADLGVPLPAASPSPTPSAAPISNTPLSPPPSAWATLDPIDPTDPILVTTMELLEQFGGVIFTGAPGTSKSWYAARIAVHLTAGGDRERMRVLQFHPSYQYEDFVEGFVPTPTGFALLPKHLLQLAENARAHPNQTHVILIDELSRGEPGRIFGEALTYVEKTKRGFDFRLASGTEVILPNNLVFLATMNPLDRGVDEVDAAFERRFAKVALDPDESILTTFLSSSGMDGALSQRVVVFFRHVNGLAADANPLAAVGHTFFIGMKDEADLQRLWNHQLRFLFDKAFRLDRDGLRGVHQKWDDVVRPTVPPMSS